MDDRQLRDLLADRLQTRRRDIATTVKTVREHATTSGCAAHGPLTELMTQTAGGLQDLLEVQEIELRQPPPPQLTINWKQVLIGLACIGALITGSIRGPAWLADLLK
jgi:hypothetical protein